MKSRTIQFGLLACCVGGSASAQLCTSYPYTNVPSQIMNGYTADASQILADFSYIGGCAAPTANPAFTGNVGIGISSPIVELAVGGTYTTTSPNQVTFAGTLVSSVTGTQSGTVLASVFSPSAALTQADELNVTAPITGSNAISTVVGVNSVISLQSGYSGALNIGNEFDAGQPLISNGASITNLRGYVAPAFTNGNGITTGTITNIGYLANSPTAASAGGIVNNYDVELNLPNAPALAGTNHNYALYITGNGSTGAGTTSNYAIFSNSTANSYLAGSLGVGTSSPSQLLHAYQNVAADDMILVQNAYSGNGAYLKSWANSNWSNYQSAGTGVVWTAGQAGSTAFQIQDVTDSTLPLTIVKGAPSSSFYVTASGAVGLGTATPAQTLEVNGEVQVDTFASATSVNLCLNGNVLATCSSSIRYKENVKDVSFGLDEILKMRPVTFKWKGRDENDFGLIAEEVAKINPLFVTYRNGKIEGVKYPQLTAVLVGAVKELEARNEKLAASVKDHEAELIQQKHGLLVLGDANSELRARLAEEDRRLDALETRLRVRSASLERIPTRAARGRD